MQNVRNEFWKILLFSRQSRFMHQSFYSWTSGENRQPSWIVPQESHETYTKYMYEIQSIFECLLDIFGKLTSFIKQ